MAGGAGERGGVWAVGTVSTSAVAGCSAARWDKLFVAALSTTYTTPLAAAKFLCLPVARCSNRFRRCRFNHGYTLRTPLLSYSWHHELCLGYGVCRSLSSRDKQHNDHQCQFRSLSIPGDCSQHGETQRCPFSTLSQFVRQLRVLEA